ncbi:MAG: hypothetical protein Q9175_006117 [Cornicularia normoerica]
MPKDTFQASPIHLILQIQAMVDLKEEVGSTTPPLEQLTDQQRLAVQKNPSSAFSPPAISIVIPVLQGAQNWDRWYNSILGMCEMADIDGILTGESFIPITDEKEANKAFQDRNVYWKTANEYITGTIRYSLKSRGLAQITGISNAHQMVEKLKGVYEAKGHVSQSPMAYTELYLAGELWKYYRVD